MNHATNEPPFAYSYRMTICKECNGVHIFLLSMNGKVIAEAIIPPECILPTSAWLLNAHKAFNGKPSAIN